MHPSRVPTSPELEVLLWGATSSTGRLIAEYLVRHHMLQAEQGPPLRFALGGRSEEKLRALRQTLTELHPGAADLPLVVGDAFDPGFLDSLVQRTRVVLSTVGPYALYGRPLVAACARHGVDYTDLTGEVPFMRDIILAHHAQAQETGARIVPACGFDSIPFDLGVWMMHAHMVEVHGGRLASVRTYITKARGGLGGGTAATAFHMMEAAAKDASLRKVLADPYALCPDAGGPDGPDALGVHWDDDLGGWTGPSVMAATNQRVVRRSNLLLGHAYGADFSCSEGMGFRPGLKGWSRAAAVSAGLAVGTLAMLLPPTRALLKRLAPAPGEGPSKEVRESGCFALRLVGRGVTASGGEIKLEAEVSGPGDPGHTETAKMIAEASMCLVREQGLPVQGGVLTSASALGAPLLERLRSRGMVFRVWESASGHP